MPAADRPWAVYLLECQGERTYLGISPDPQQRFEAHVAGRGSFFTRLNRPTRIACVVWFSCRRHAAVMERKLKLVDVVSRREWLERWQLLAQGATVDFEAAEFAFDRWKERRG